MHTFCGVWLRFKSTQNRAILTINPITATTKNLICKCVAMIFSNSSIFAFNTAPIMSNFISARRFFFLPLPRFPIACRFHAHTHNVLRLEKFNSVFIPSAYRTVCVIHKLRCCRLSLEMCAAKKLRDWRHFWFNRYYDWKQPNHTNTSWKLLSMPHYKSTIATSKETNEQTNKS